MNNDELKLLIKDIQLKMDEISNRPDKEKEIPLTDGYMAGYWSAFENIKKVLNSKLMKDDN